MSKHSIKFRLSDEAQKAALLAGLDARTEQTLEFPRITENHVISGSGLGGSYVVEKDDPAVLAQALELGAKIRADGSLLLDATECLNCGHAFATPPRDALHALQLFAEATVAACEAAKAEAQELEQKVSEQRNTQNQWLTPYLFGDPQAGHPWNNLVTVAPTKPYSVMELRWLSATEAQREDVRATSARRASLKEDAEKAARAKDNAAREAKEQAEIKAALDLEQRLCELVRPLDASAAARIDAGGERLLGLLPESEALDILRDHALPIPEGLEAYQKLQAIHVCICDEMDAEDMHCSFLTFKGDELPEIDRDAWDDIQTAKAKLAQADQQNPEIIAHRGRCEKHDDCPDVWAYGLKVTKDLGQGLTVSREYGV